MWKKKKKNQQKTTWVKSTDFLPVCYMPEIHTGKYIEKEGLSFSLFAKIWF